MEWEPKPGTNPDPSDRPRLLTPEEIASIVNKLPPVRSADELAGKIAREDLIKLYTDEFSRHEYSPSQIPAIAEDFVLSYRRSQIQWATPVGPFVSEGFGATTTQMTLNTFHQSGSAKNVSYGIRALRDLIFARKKRQAPSATIYFKDRVLTFAEVLNKRSDLVGCVINDFIQDYDIDDPSAFQRYYWHDTYPIITGKTIPKSSQVLRLFFNVSRLFAYRVSLTDIAASLEKEVPPSVICVCGPISSGIIDVYPDESMIGVTLQTKKVFVANMAARAFLELIVYPQLDRIRIKGVQDLRRLFPLESPVWRVVVEEIKVTENMLTPNKLDNFRNQLDRLWMLRINAEMMVITGISNENILYFLASAGVQTLTANSETRTLFIMMPENWTTGLKKIGSLKPGDYMADQVNQYERTPINERSVKYPYEIPRYSKFVYATADINPNLSGPSNVLYDLLAREDVDATRTITGNIHEIAQVLGIEAARAFLVHEYNEVIENAEGYISPPAIELMADFQTSKGIFLGLTYHGVSRQGNGHITMATNERAAQVLKTSSVFSKVEDTGSASVAIAVGREPRLGTGAIQTILTDETKSNQWLEELRVITAEKMRAVEAQLEQGTINLSAVDTDMGLDEYNRRTYAANILDDRGEANEVDPSNIFDIPEIVPDITGRSRILASQVANRKPNTLVNGVMQSNRTRPDEVVSKQLLDALESLKLPQVKPVSDVRNITVNLPPPQAFLPTIVPLGTGIPPALASRLNEITIVRTAEQQIIQGLHGLTLAPPPERPSKITLPPMVGKISIPSVPPISKITLPPPISQVVRPPSVSKITLPPSVVSKITLPPSVVSKITLPPPSVVAPPSISKITLPPPSVIAPPSISQVVAPPSISKITLPPSLPPTPGVVLPSITGLTVEAAEQGEKPVEQVNIQAFIQAMAKK